MEYNNISINEIKDQLYSRQIASIGIESMKKISELKILIIGLRGLGVEICKNIILQGPYKLSIFDNTISDKRDLCCNFYLEEKDIGIKRRDSSIIKKLIELNKYVNVECLSQYNSIEEIEEIIEEYNIVVITEIIKKEKLVKINKKCREKNIKFIFGVTLGLTGYIFSDFGNEHLILNKNDKEPKIFSIKNINNDINGLVELEEINEGISNVKSVVFSNIEGMTELNDKEPIIIKIKDQYSFYIGDTSKYNKYIKGGLVKEKQIPIKKEFEGIEKRLNVPYNKKGNILSFIHDDEEKISPELLYMVLIEIIEHFQKKDNSILYMNDNIYEYNNIIEKIKRDINIKKDEYWIKNIEEINEAIIKNICLNCNKEIPCLTSYLGGIISQEIIKTIGKYFPIDQWAIFDFSDNYINDITNNNNKKVTRYDYLYDIFGYENIINMQNKKILLIGTGALGCELLKHFGLLGMKNCTAIDDDYIELSNLNRQFLFKDKDIGKQKVTVACNSILKMNSELKNYIGISKRIEKETENIFNEKFWKEQDAIFCALDSISGRMYIDGKCILYEKPWINGGMNGIKGKTEIFIPFKTCCLNDINYGEEDVNNEGISCTLRYFPTKIDQCILWAKNLFFQYFIYYIYDFEKIFKNEKYTEVMQKEFDEKNKNELIKLNILYQYLKIYHSKDINDVKILAFNIFHLNYIAEIEEILRLYPKDLKKEDGSLFWKNKKIPSQIIINDNIINLYNQFLYNYIKILSSIFNINIDNLNEILEINSKIDFILNIDKNDLIEKIIDLKKNINIIQINKIEFQKDIINNGHVDFIHYCACLRAIIYNIPLCDKYKTFKIAGNIAPSTITINSTLGGLMSLKLINLFCGENKIKKYTIDFDEGSGSYIEESPFGLYYKNSYYDNSCKCNIIVLPKKFTLWDKIEIKGSITISEFIDYIRKEYNVEITLINANDCIIYEKKVLREIDKLLERKRGKKNNNNLISEKIENAYKRIKGSINNEVETIFLQITGNFGDSRVLMPTFKYLYIK